MFYCFANMKWFHSPEGKVIKTNDFDSRINRRLQRQNEHTNKYNNLICSRHFKFLVKKNEMIFFTIFKVVLTFQEPFRCFDLLFFVAVQRLEKSKIYVSEVFEEKKNSLITAYMWVSVHVWSRTHTINILWWFLLR